MLNICYCTFPKLEEAKKISKILIEERLIACSHIFNSGISLYQWEGEIKEEEEFICFWKTTEDKIKNIKEKVTQSHSYDVPCILNLKVVDYNDDYGKWLKGFLKE